ncbi:MAG TPA: hypothetical protein PLN31_17760 [Azoarcus taiwanensis]|nr:hypothetical protein [Azoarcus taiwanensis]
MTMLLGAGGVPVVPFAVFLLIVGSLLALDLVVLNRRAHVVRAREALAWTAF